ncbi:UDP-N-acetylglucosamine 1-carboxyvinyltransferase [Sulfurihydrogenibium azorense]|jgi:UDP-N-acetylglucosamine 1-carboxyvinyltransferase|uniref:UDP-N-acetylglucosamine 1-carboxyvinyltransferase n=1 Tax=Sulfurihydrogenibium azorense (strain DSM 15241 / OCM 825 / Az-Fu1) TaxID=204536 RepID=C1DV73_SULAA|nr:UDP-N-acetylglucosamine 1-carboxyvinyltransferase [Sulfurihydrogenibium azorense]ACN99797.1 UDP-N-acetylglucosamine 1-carboxyvinyltransferase [Sulfurihydrogenibium azorense Az-Fu1]MDM7273204.1 UDP-N-acetylglucosamine 1-carboxyvinyltransferase [Sulfurihydrogenibium azorense]
MIKEEIKLKEALIVEGGCRLEGVLEVSGAKNAALPNMAATILTDEEVIIENLPNLLDIQTMEKLLTNIGVAVNHIKDKTYSFKANNITSLTAPYDLVSKMRASILILGPMLTRFGYAEVALPGGCSIGTRPVDLHLKALEKMGAEITLEHGYIKAYAPRGLKGAHIFFDKITVTGTENIMMAAVLAEGKTIIENAALEPEVVDLAVMLKKMGANIKGEGTHRIEIEGVKSLKGTYHTVIPDRIEAGTFAVLSALTDGKIIIKNYPSYYLEYVDEILEKIGVSVVKISDNEVVIKRKDTLKPVNIETKEYPLFPTDLQAQFMTLLCFADGVSEITENIFENRFMHVPELNRLGANIDIKGKTAIVKPVKKFSGAHVKATDLRASAAMVIAGLVAEGETTIHSIYHLDRGYEHIDEKLKSIGAKIRREVIEE